MNLITKAILFGGIALLLIGGITLWVMRMNTQTQWNRQNNAVEAVFQKQKVAHDEMWKVIKTQMGLKDELRDITMAAMQAYSERGKSYSGTQWLWLQEQFPQLNQTGSSEFYQKLSNIISDQNGKFTAIRNDVVMVTNEYNNFVTNSWTQFFLSAEQCKTREAKIITSGVTNRAAESGEDNLDWLENKNK